MTDMRAVIIPKSDQLNADDLISGPRTVTITSVSVQPGTEQPVAISFDGDDGKPYKPCKSMCRVMVAMWGADAKEYAGHSMTLYRDPKVRWAGLEVGGIRISHMSDIERDHVMALTESKQSRKPFTVKPLRVTPPPSERPHAPAEPAPEATTAAGKGKADEARARFLVALAKCKDLGEAGELDHKLGASTELLGEHYAECAAAMQAKVDQLRGPVDGDHHDAFAELEDDDWKKAPGRVEDDRQGEIL